MPKDNTRKTNRAPQGAGGICKRSDGRWQGTYTVGTNPGTGKPMKKYVYAQSEKECVKKLKALQAAVDNGAFIEPSRMTVGQHVEIHFKMIGHVILPALDQKKLAGLQLGFGREDARALAA